MYFERFFLLFNISAGVGRTGTLIALNLLIEEAAKSTNQQEPSIDINHCVKHLRQQRVKMVQKEVSTI